MIPTYNFKKYDPSAKIVITECLSKDEEHHTFFQTFKGITYQFSTRYHLIPISLYKTFIDRCNQQEYTYSYEDNTLADIEAYLNRGHYNIIYDGRRGRIIFERRDEFVASLGYPSELATWMPERNNYTLSISEVYKVPQAIFSRYKNLKFDISEEVKEILEKEAIKRKDLLLFATLEDAPEIADDINLKLHPFQRVAKKFALHNNINAIISLDMGLGKTPVSISTIESNPLLKKILIVCPATLKPNWRREILKATGLESNYLSGSVPSEAAIKSVLIPTLKYHIINFDILGRGTRDGKTGAFISPWARILNAARFDAIIIDEAHYAKNMDSGRSKAVRELESPHFLLLTGTPIVNRPSELYPLLYILDKKNFPAYESFSNQWLYSDKVIRNPEAFKEMLSSYMFRRRKEDVIKDLPHIQRLDHFFELSEQARIHYTQAEAGVYASLRNPHYEKDINSILAQLIRLKQLVAEDTVKHTIELAQDIWEESEKKVLIFSQFVQSCKEIYTGLGHENSLIITGETSNEERYEKIDKFQNDKENKYKYMILSTKAGAEGITLTAAEYIIFNDLCWTPKDHRQAEARCYGRMNDMHGAIAYYMQAEKTITQWIMELLKDKMNLIESTVDGVNTSANEGASIINEFLKKMRGY